MKRLDELIQESRSLKDRFKHGQVTAVEYLGKIQDIAQEYIDILDSLAVGGSPGYVVPLENAPGRPPE